MADVADTIIFLSIWWYFSHKIIQISPTRKKMNANFIFYFSFPPISQNLLYQDCMTTEYNECALNYLFYFSFNKIIYLFKRSTGI